MINSMNFKIISTARALPRRIVSTKEVAAICNIPVDIAISRSGVLERRWLSEDETALQLGVQAARKAISSSNLNLNDIDVLINASGSQLQPIPDGAILLGNKLNFVGKTAYSIHGTCLSFLFALHHASLLISAQQARYVLIISTESSSLGLDFSQPESSLLFGDGAVAVLLGPADDMSQGIKAHRFETYPEGASLTQIRGGGSLLNNKSSNISDKDYLFDMRGLSVLKLASRVVPGFLERLHTGLSTSSMGIDRIIPHQSSAAGIALMQKYGWGEKMEVTLPYLGNVVAASIPLTLHAALENGNASSGDTILLFGTGAGLTVGGLILVL